MADKVCVWFDELTRGDVPLAGGKGANLGDMVRASLPVPPGYVITAPAYRRMIERAGLETRIDDLLLDLDRNACEQLQAVEPRIRDLFVHAPVPPDIEASILEHYRRLNDTSRETGKGDICVAVRSSATAEDLAGASFAGQQETFLNIAGEAALMEAVRRCWSSLYTSQAIFYRCQKGFDDLQVSMAVVVQKMVDSEKSGVSFTVDPVLRNHYQMIVEGVWGLGEGIVSGQITPDHYKVDKETCEILFEFVPEKKIMYCRNTNGGVEVLPVVQERVSARVLSDDELQKLVTLGNHVEQHFGCPQDIEWAIENDVIYLLQSRPVTCL